MFYKIIIPLFSTILFFFFCEFSIRILNPSQISFKRPIQLKVDHNKMEDLRIALYQYGPIKKYPSISNEVMDDWLKYSPYIFLPNSLMHLKPNTHARSLVRSLPSKQLIYDVIVNTDSAGRRKMNSMKNFDSEFVFLGDSFTFGDGVNDFETFPFYFSKFRNHTQVYNLGAPGLGLNDFLYDLEFLNDKKYSGIGSKPVTVVYTYINDHLFRFFCGLYCYRDGWEWILNKPQFNDNLELQGTFAENKSLKNFVLKFLAKSRLLSYFGLNWPLRYSDADIDLFAKAVLKLKALSMKKLHAKEFYFLFYPKATSLLYSQKLTFYLKKYGIKFLIYDDIDLNYLGKNIESIPLDDHPTPMAHYLTAYLLNKAL